MEQSIEAVSENLRTVRESRGLSLDQLAERTGVSKYMCIGKKMASAIMQVSYQS
ncbi:MAG: hypothetical protein V2B20_24560 [Pseudomonadota bacterium]